MPRQDYTAKALDALEALRQNSEAALAARRRTAIGTIPTLETVENEIMQAGIAAALAGGNAEKLAVLNALIEKKADLLKAAGFGANYLNLQPACPLCGDKGRVKGALCSCVEQRVKAMRRADILAESPLALCSFSGFNLNFYPDAEDQPNGGINPRRHMEEVLAFCTAYAEDFEKNPGSLLFMGRAGLGKTHLALAIAGAVLEQGRDVLYVSAQSAFSQIEKDNFSGEDMTFRDALLAADLLVVDDLGTEFLSPYILSELYRLVDTRFNTKRPTIYTTNLVTEAAIAARYTEKIASRLMGNCQTLHFFGADIRKLNNL